MARVALLLLAAALCWGQAPPATPDKPPPQTSPAPPPEVDAALRARISQFYGLEVAGKFNQALQLVADDTKDLFVGSSKASYTAFELRGIQYYDDFTQAQASVLVTRMLAMEGFTGHPLPMMTLSRWKLENGLWCYFVDPQKDMPLTPFGKMPIPGMAPPPGMPNPMPAGSQPQRPPLPAHLPDARMLTPDKSSVQLKSSGPSSDQVTISNTSPWREALTLSDPKVPGLSVKLTPTSINPRQKAILSVSLSEGAQIPKTPVMIVVTVPQTMQKIPIKVLFN